MTKTDRPDDDLLRVLRELGQRLNATFDPHPEPRDIAGIRERMPIPEAPAPEPDLDDLIRRHTLVTGQPPRPGMRQAMRAYLYGPADLTADDLGLHRVAEEPEGRIYGPADLTPDDLGLRRAARDESRDIGPDAPCIPVDAGLGRPGGCVLPAPEIRGVRHDGNPDPREEIGFPQRRPRSRGLEWSAEAGDRPPACVSLFRLTVAGEEGTVTTERTYGVTRAYPNRLVITDEMAEAEEAAIRHWRQRVAARERGAARRRFEDRVLGRWDDESDQVPDPPPPAQRGLAPLPRRTRDVRYQPLDSDAPLSGLPELTEILREREVNPFFQPPSISEPYPPVPPICPAMPGEPEAPASEETLNRWREQTR